MFSIKKEGNIDFSKHLKEFQKWQKKEMLDETANIALAHFETGFELGGKMTDKSKGGWSSLKNGKKSYLTKTGALSSSLRYKRYKGGVQIFTKGRKVNKYAGVHNKGKGKQKKREFIGYSKKLNKKLKKYYAKTMHEIFG